MKNSVFIQLSAHYFKSFTAKQRRNILLNS